MYTPIEKEAFWTGRTDVLDGEDGARFHHKIQTFDLENDSPSKIKSNDFVLLGYKTNQGVKRNQGRIGAFDGPDAIRKMLANLPWHLDNDTALYDAGNVDDSKQDLETVQDTFSQLIADVHTSTSKSIAFGGGHDIAFAHFSGLQKAYPGKHIGIINFDAHFDLRKPESSYSSGTPFYQINNSLKEENLPFYYLCVGIQEFSNTKALFNKAKETNTKWILADQVRMEKLKTLKEQIQVFSKNVDALYITICLDVFSSAFAPGVSATNPIGIQPDIVMTLINYIASTYNTIGFDIAEMNPHYDIDNRTARLAASLIYQFINANKK